MGHNFTSAAAAIYHFYVIGRFMDEVPHFSGRFGLKDVQLRTAVCGAESGSRTRRRRPASAEELHSPVAFCQTAIHLYECEFLGTTLKSA